MFNNSNTAFNPLSINSIISPPEPEELNQPQSNVPEENSKTEKFKGMNLQSERPVNQQKKVVTTPNPNNNLQDMGLEKENEELKELLLMLGQRYRNLESLNNDYAESAKRCFFGKKGYDKWKEYYFSKKNSSQMIQNSQNSNESPQHTNLEEENWLLKQKIAELKSKHEKMRGIAQKNYSIYKRNFINFRRSYNTAENIKNPSKNNTLIKKDHKDHKKLGENSSNHQKVPVVQFFPIHNGVKLHNFNNISINSENTQNNAEEHPAKRQKRI